MRGVVTVFGDSLNLNFTYADYFWIAFPFIMFFASLICMFAGRWKAARVAAILLALFNVVLLCMYREREFLLTSFLTVSYAMIICGIVYNKLKIQKQQQLSIFNDAENQQQSELQQADENEHTDKR